MSLRIRRLVLRLDLRRGCRVRRPLILRLRLWVLRLRDGGSRLGVKRPTRHHLRGIRIRLRVIIQTGVCLRLLILWLHLRLLYLLGRILLLRVRLLHLRKNGLVAPHQCSESKAAAAERAPERLRRSMTVNAAGRAQANTGRCCQRARLISGDALLVTAVESHRRPVGHRSR